MSAESALERTQSQPARDGEGQASAQPPAARLPRDTPRDGEFGESSPSYTRYELLFEIASGGMGTVYAGLRRGTADFARVVAIKRIRSTIAEDEQANAALYDEAAIASLVQHANVVPIHDVTERGEELWLVMDYVDGVSLGHLLRTLRDRGKRLSRGVALRILYDALCGLHAAHELTDHHGRPLELVHRDATPQNILIGTDGCVRLTDFGIARAVERSVHTDPGLAKGKYAYMAPEHAFAEPLDRRADVFAMGVVLWEMLTGRRLFQNRTMREVARGTALGHIPAPRHRGADSPPELDAIVLKAMAPWKDDRYPTAKHFADAIDAFASAEGDLPPASAIAETLDLVCGQEVRERATRLRNVLRVRAPSLNSRSGLRRRVRPEEATADGPDPARPTAPPREVPTHAPPPARPTAPTLVDVAPPAPPASAAPLSAAPLSAEVSPASSGPLVVTRADDSSVAQAHPPVVRALRLVAFATAAGIWAVVLGIALGALVSHPPVPQAKRFGVKLLTATADAARAVDE